MYVSKTLKTAWTYSKWPTIATVVLHAITAFVFFPNVFLKQKKKLINAKSNVKIPFFNVTLRRLALRDIDNQRGSSGSQWC